MPEFDSQPYVNELLVDGQKISDQNAGDEAYGRLDSVDALADLTPEQINAVLTQYNQQNDSDNLPDASIVQDQDGLFITFGDPEVPTTVQAQSESRNAMTPNKELGKGHKEVPPGKDNLKDFKDSGITFAMPQSLSDEFDDTADSIHNDPLRDPFDIKRYTWK